MTRDEMGITVEGERYIEAIIRRGLTTTETAYKKADRDVEFWRSKLRESLGIIDKERIKK